MVAVLLGLPILIDLAFIWGPTLATVGLSFTKWNGVGGLSSKTCQPNVPSILNNGCLFGVQNYLQASTSTRISGPRSGTT